MWMCTDSDNAQYCKRWEENPNIFSFMEVRQIGDRYAVVHATIDLECYTALDQEEECEAYYDSLYEIINDYGWFKAAQIIAECIFENTPTSDMSALSCWSTESEAYEQIEKMAKAKSTISRL